MRRRGWREHLLPETNARKTDYVEPANLRSSIPHFDSIRQGSLDAADCRSQRILPGSDFADTHQLRPTVDPQRTAGRQFLDDGSNLGRRRPIGPSGRPLLESPQSGNHGICAVWDLRAAFWSSLSWPPQTGS